MRTKTRHRTYAAARRYLERHLGKIEQAWRSPNRKKGGSFFLFCTSSGHVDEEEWCGCLTQLKACLMEPNSSCAHIPGMSRTLEKRLLKKLRNDARIPSDVNDVGVEHLAAFEEWQNDFDEAFRMSTSGPQKRKRHAEA